MKSHPGSLKAQGGTALVVALIFLTALALLGTSGAMNNAVQERMAGNTRNRDLAFEAAEHALRDAEASLPALLDPNGDGNTADQTGTLANGEDHANDAAYWSDPTNWPSGSSLHSAGGAALQGVASQPVYVVERMPGYTDTTVTPNIPYEFYRITARGVGGTSDSIVILQSMYRLKMG